MSIEATISAERQEWLSADKLDADRYRKLRSIALDGRGLEAAVAFWYLDFIQTAERFDAVVDAG